MATPGKVTQKMKVEIAKGKVEGKSDLAIAKELQVCNHTIRHHLAKQDMKALIETIRARVIEESGMRAADNFIHAIGAYQDPEADTQLRDHGFKASVMALQATGSLPTQNTSIVVQNIYNDNRSAVPPEILEVLKGLNSRGGAGSLVIEGEMEEE